ncbi:hypothetical protein WKW80_31770 [Variovorax humicola]|uniref:Uncharacterized protein n=1 Tax=Variovorax humicola TaxID=1769758 RepID=A0ABU8W928_9BURK
MQDLWLGARLLLLLAVANITPIAAKDLLGARWAWPLDGGTRALFRHRRRFLLPANPRNDAAGLCGRRRARRHPTDAA